MKLMKRLPICIAIAICCATAFIYSNHQTHRDKVQPVSGSNPLVLRNPFGVSSPAHQEIEAYWQWLSGNQKFSEETGTVSMADKLKASKQYIDRGMARVPTHLLEQRLASVSNILISLDTHTCGEYVKGTMSIAEWRVRIHPILESFNAAEAKAWFTVDKFAIDAQLTSPIIQLSAEDAKKAIRELVSSMYEPDAQKFMAELASLKSAENDDACETARVLFQRGNALREPYRGFMARMLLTGDQGHQRL